MIQIMPVISEYFSSKISLLLRKFLSWNTPTLQVLCNNRLHALRAYVDLGLRGFFQVVHRGDTSTVSPLLLVVVSLLAELGRKLEQKQHCYCFGANVTDCFTTRIVGQKKECMEEEGMEG